MSTQAHKKSYEVLPYYLAEIKGVIDKILRMLPPFASERKLNWFKVNYALTDLKKLLEELEKEIPRLQYGDLTHRHLCRFEARMENFLRCKRQRINGREYYSENPKYSEAVSKSSELTTLMIHISRKLEDHFHKVIAGSVQKNKNTSEEGTDYC